MNKKFFLILIVGFCILFFSVIFSLINITNTKIIKGIFINGIDISGLTQAEAYSKLNSLIEPKQNNSISIYLDETKVKDISFDSLEVSYNLQSCIDEAYNIGRSNNIFKSNFQILSSLINKHNLNVEITLNEENLQNLIDDINYNLPNKLIQSDYYIDGSNLIINKGLAGSVVDEPLFKKNLYNNLRDFKNLATSFQLNISNAVPETIDIDKIYNEIYKEPKDAYYENNPFKVYPEVIGVSFNKEYTLNLLNQNLEEYIIPLDFNYPNITINQLGIDIFKNSLAYFSTNYNSLNTARSNNLELAASKIDGTIINPGETFSYNKKVGARTIKEGYKEAAIYSDGNVVDGIGGGICQISSILYNAAVLANLEITERHNHQFLTSYVPART